MKRVPRDTLDLTTGAARLRYKRVSHLWIQAPKLIGAVPSMQSTIVNALLSVDFKTFLILFLVSSLAFVILPYILDKHHIRSNKVPGPVLAGFSDAWLGWTAAHGHRSEDVHVLHQRYGTFVRLAPNQ